MEIFQKHLAEFGICLTKKQMNQFQRYYELLVSWNEKMNLTAITQRDEVFQKHFVDSVSLIKAIDLNHEMNVIDVGTGAGFPGLALKIAFPEKIRLCIILCPSMNRIDSGKS